jgi:hypothetical protein
LFLDQRVASAEGRCSVANRTAARHRRAAKAAQTRAQEILEIKPGSLTVYTAYVVLLVRLVVLAVNGLSLGPR